MDTNIFQPITDHLIISLASWAISLFAGSVVAYAIWKIVNSLFTQKENYLKLSKVIPWRSLAAWITLVAITHPLIQLVFGISNLSGIVSISIILFVWTVPFTLKILQGNKTNNLSLEKILNLARLLAIFSITITAITYHGTGFLIGERGFRGGNDQIAYQGYELTAAMLFLIDIIFGFIDLSLVKKSLNNYEETSIIR